MRFEAQNMRWRSIWRLAAASFFLSAGARTAASFDNSHIPAKGLAGIWELSNEETAQKCRISLRPEFLDGGRRQLAIPLACLRAFPILGPAETWTEDGNGRLVLSGRAGQTILEFAPNGDAFLAAGQQGETYRLAAKSTQKEPSPHQQGSIPPAPGAAGAPQEHRGAAAPAPAAGRYAILRAGGKDTGCMLILDNQGRTAGGAKASLAPGCRDQGIVIFDPARWQVVNGRLVLIARKGHTTHLDAQPDGTWTKDPKEGTALSLKKL